MSTRSNKQMEDIQHDILHAKPGADEIGMSPLHQSPRPESVGIRKSIQTPCERQKICTFSYSQLTNMKNSGINNNMTI